MAFKFSNNASSTLSSGITNSDTTIIVQPGDGALFPALSGSDWFHAVLEDSGGNYEIVRVTARSADQMTVTRAQEGTTAQAFSTGTRFEIRVTAGTLDSLVQNTGGAITGDFDFDGALTANSYTVDTTGETIEPDGNTRTAIDGKAILTVPYTDAVPERWVVPSGLIAAWWGSTGSIPAGWRLCDGSSHTGEDGVVRATPDLRDRFIVGASASYAVGATGGNITASTSSAGSHNHGGYTHYHTLTISQIPSHRHTYSGFGGGSGSTYRPYDQSSTTRYTGYEGGGGAHRHGISSDGTHSHTVDVRPPFHALCWIMKI